MNIELAKEFEEPVQLELRNIYKESDEQCPSCYKSTILVMFPSINASHILFLYCGISFCVYSGRGWPCAKKYAFNIAKIPQSVPFS